MRSYLLVLLGALFPLDAALADEKGAGPEGAKVYFVSNNEPGVRAAIYVMDLDGKGRKRVGKSDENEYDPAPSRDGGRLAFTAIEPKIKGASDVLHSRIGVMNTDGSERRKVTGNDEWAFGPNWSPDGKRIVYCSIKPGTTGGGVVKASRVCVIGVDGKDKQELTDGFNASWTPDGKEVLFVRAVGKPEEFQFKTFRLKPDGKSEPKELEIKTGAMPVYSPDGKWIAYIGTPRPFELAAFITSPDGKERRRLSEPPVKNPEPADFTGEFMDLECRWSIDGKHLFVTRMGPDGPRFRIHVFDVASGKRTQLTPAAKDDVLGLGLVGMRY